jgi:hypothetical protein
MPLVFFERLVEEWPGLYCCNYDACKLKRTLYGRKTFIQYRS